MSTYLRRIILDTSRDVRASIHQRRCPTYLEVVVMLWIRIESFARVGENGKMLFLKTRSFGDTWQVVLCYLNDLIS